MHWISPVGGGGGLTSEEKIHALVAQERIFAFAERTYARKHIGPGDLICFYASGRGIVAHARIATSPERKLHMEVLRSELYPWVILLEDVHLYWDKPVRLDYETRTKLNALKGQKHWQWLVQTTRWVTFHDFQILTRNTT